MTPNGQQEALLFSWGHSQARELFTIRWFRLLEMYFCGLSKGLRSKSSIRLLPDLKNVYLSGFGEHAD